MFFRFCSVVKFFSFPRCLPFLPGDVGHSGAVVEVARQDEEVVAQAVYVFHERGVHVFLLGEGDDAAFCAAADGACHLREGREGCAAGENEGVYLGRLRVEFVCMKSTHWSN